MAIKHYTQALTPQQPIPGREAEMHRNAAGGVVFTLDDWQRLDRFLMMGSETGTYYAGAQALSVENAQVAQRCLQADPLRVLGRVIELDGQHRLLKLSPALLVLAMASAHSDNAIRRTALESAKLVCRTAPALFEYIEYTQKLRGWGRGLKNMVQAWYNDTPADKLAYQMLKYKQRGGWSHRDLLRLAKPVPPDAEHDILYAWASGKDWAEKDRMYIMPFQVRAAEDVAHADDVALTLYMIEKHRLTWEMLPTQQLAKPEVWWALLRSMPLRAMVRNLGRMSAIGVFDGEFGKWGVKTVADALHQAAAIQRSRLHPLHILQALTQYQYGQGDKGNKTWRVNPAIVEALDWAFGLSVHTQVPVPGRICVAIDTSGSMFGQATSGNITAVEAAAAMALPLLHQAEQASLMVFDTTAKRLPNWKAGGEKLAEFTRSVVGYGGGGTDLSAPILAALREDGAYDAFVVLTDNETWAGRVRPEQALLDYRARMHPQAKLVVCSLTATAGSVGDPKDAGTLQTVGVDPLLPSVVANFLGAGGAVEGEIEE